MELVVPSPNYQHAFEQFYFDYVKNDPVNGECYAECMSNFSAYVRSLLDEAQGINLKPTYVPCSHHWFINPQGQIVGVIRVRHNIDNTFLSQEGGHIGYDIAPSQRGQGYGKAMLAAVLPELKSLDISRALITADEDNIASRRVIEANGGQLDNVIFGATFQCQLARYWVSI
ncbi:GNAT family N-acetyltransferase [Vibrio sp. LaRot3]|uniref:GNAT family N-acetyltransferase n=1 Tax=Vibrio sp. LaRot3 TaxID=2998829 RepID=UPI0022CDD61B|nr:GNAT family N-acetyltransferase [Vibrio sp. LaRot3]MDA0149594.1 GNAT family N-acetyltransferase [Vibrio sp. LaRot3]